MAHAANTTVLERDGRQFHIIGTAHVSQGSVEEVKSVIDEVRPDAVCIELCPTRYEALTDADRWKNLDIFKVIREGKMLMLLANLAVGAYQRRIGQELGVEPGAELLAGADMAEEIGAELCLVDRDIQVTLKRTWGNLKFFDKLKLLGAVIGSLVSKDDISADEIESLKEQSELSNMMAEFAEALPAVKEPLIDERDMFLMSKIEEAPGSTVVAVVGAAHVAGMTQYFGQSVDRGPLSTLPTPTKWVKYLKWVIPAIIVGAFAFGANQTDGKTLQEMVLAWLLPNSILSGLGAAIAGGKVLSIITAFVASPITSLNPLIGAGMAAGLVEAWLRKPTVADCENINQDVQSLGGLYRNPFTRVLLVAVLANIGSALGAYVGVTFVLSYLT